MEYPRISKNINKIESVLQDQTSVLLFNARLHYSITRDKKQFYKAVDTVEKNWICPELERFLEKTQGEGIIVWGCGHDGKETKRVLDLCGHPPAFFCDRDTDKVGSRVEGVEVISFDSLVKKYSHYSVVIGSGAYKREMYRDLVSNNFPEQNILNPRYNHLQARTEKKQYFDVFKPDENEIFVDVGAYLGETIWDFVQWTNRNYLKIIAMEPSEERCRHIAASCKERGLKNVYVKAFAAWEKEDRLFFKEDKAGSRVEQNKQDNGNVVKAIDMDNIIQNDPVTFIKMDIEGGELKALKGAGMVIKRERPKLAISLYHKPEDIIELPLYLLELVPEYKFYIRHYRSDICETVLYAYV